MIKSLNYTLRTAPILGHLLLYVYLQIGWPGWAQGSGGHPWHGCLQRRHDPRVAGPDREGGQENAHADWTLSYARHNYHDPNLSQCQGKQEDQVRYIECFFSTDFLGYILLRNLTDLNHQKCNIETFVWDFAIGELPLMNLFNNAFMQTLFCAHHKSRLHYLLNCITPTSYLS